nr:transposase [Streptomyces sp. AcE210]
MRELRRTAAGVQRRRRPHPPSRAPPPEVALSKLVNRLQGVSSRYLRADYTGRINRIGTGSVFWSPSYFAGSCGGAA